MYNTGQAYIAEMDSQNPHPVTSELTIYNINQVSQSNLSVSITGPLEAYTGSGVTAVPARPIRKLATAEPGYLRVEAQGYTPPDAGYWLMDDLYNSGTELRDPWYYISAARASDTMAPGKDDYPLAGVTLTIACADTGMEDRDWPATLTLYAEGISRVQITTPYATDGSASGQTWELTVDSAGSDAQGRQYIDLGVGLTAVQSTLTVQVTALRQGGRRARIYGVYAGTVQYWPSYDLMEAAYKGYGDGLCLELPQRTLTTTLRNRDGWTAEDDADQPYYRRLHTMATYRFGAYLDDAGAVSWVPCGVWYLDRYTVSRESLTLTWMDPLGLLNQYTHYGAAIGTDKTMAQRAAEVTAPLANAPPDGAGGTLRSPGEIYGITVNTASMANGTAKANPPPLVTGAAVLQLIANATGNRLVCSRENKTISLTPLDLDALPVRTINHYVYAREAGADEAAPGKITVKYTDLLSTRTQTQTLEDVPVDATPSLLTLDAPALSWSANAPLQGSLYAYALYVWRDGGEVTDDITVTQYDPKPGTALSQTYDREGETLTLDNPLVGLLSGSAFALRSYMLRMRNYLKYAVMYTIQHRGFPELDEGDVIAVTTDKDTPVKAIVEENAWALRAGSFTGTTKARRLS